MQKLIKKNNKVYNTNIIQILNNIFEKEVYRFTYLGMCRLNKMPEYNFCLYEFNVMLEDYSNYTVFIKKFSDVKIEENLFCYWQFCEENYNLHGNFYLHKANLKNEFMENRKDFILKYQLQLLSKNNKIWKHSDINIIDLRKLRLQKNNNFYQDYLSNDKYNTKTKEYLFVAII